MNNLTLPILEISQEKEKRREKKTKKTRKNKTKTNKTNSDRLFSDQCRHLGDVIS